MISYQFNYVNTFLQKYIICKKVICIVYLDSSFILIVMQNFYI